MAFKNLQGDLYQHYDLARYTSWRVGGKAKQCYRPASLSDLQNFLVQLPQDEPLTWLGLGSNVLIRDGGIPGTVIFTLNRLKTITLEKDGMVRAEAGVTCAKLAKYCVQQGFEQGAFFAGIPGTVGGALAMNAGAFGGETWQHVVLVETLDRQGRLHQRTPQEFDVHYRQVNVRREEYFVAGYFSFKEGDTIHAKQNISELLKKRNASQPIGSYSCGSVFRNPPNDHAARLIESAGLKGMCVGDAEVSTKHANFILNKGQASAADIERLINIVKEKIKAQYGVELVKEVHIIGVPQA